MPRIPARRVEAFRTVEYPAVREQVLERIMVATPMDEAQSWIVEQAAAESPPFAPALAGKG